MTTIYILMKKEIFTDYEGTDQIVSTPILTSFSKSEIQKSCQEENDNFKKRKSEKNKIYNLLNSFKFTPQHKVVSDNHISKKKLVCPVFIPPIRHPNCPDEGYDRIYSSALKKHNELLAAHLEYLNAVNGVNENINRIEYEKAIEDFIDKNKIPKGIVNRWLNDGIHVFHEDDSENVNYTVESCEHSD